MITHRFPQVLSALLLIALALTALPAGRLHAQDQPPLRIEDVVFGYDGVVRRGHWFPVVATLSNDGPDIQAELVWRDEDLIFRRAVDLPRGARKRVTLMALDQRNFSNSGTISLQVGGQPLVERDLRLTAIEDDVFAIGVIGDDPALLNSLTSLRLPDWSRTTVLHFPADQIPEQWPGLAMLNVIVVGGGGSESWTDAQREALRVWVSLGGQLIFGGGVDADRISAGAADLLPVELGPTLGEAELAPLAAFAEAAPPLVASSGAEAAVPTPTPDPAQAAPPSGPVAPVEPASSSVRQASPRPEAAVLAESAGLPLLVSQRRGAGQTIFAAFELGALRGWPDEARLWQAALTNEPILALAASYRRGSDNLLQSVLQLPGLGLPSTWALLLYLLAYVLLVGPANYFLLRRLDRREWAWLSVPATVALFAAGTYLLGFGVRGGSVLLNQVAVVQSSEGEASGAATTFVGMFSPRRGSYTLSFPGSALVADLSSFDGSLGDGSAPLVEGERTLVQDLLVDVGALRTLVTEHTAPLPFQVSSSLREVGGTLEGELRLDGASVQQALIVRGENVVSLGDIAGGEAKQLRVQLSSNNFPWGAGAETEGTFNRQQIINSLFSIGRFGPWSSGAWTQNVDAAFLLAWVEQPVIDARAEDASTGQNSLTLYVIQLKPAQGS